MQNPAAARRLLGSLDIKLLQPVYVATVAMKLLHNQATYPVRRMCTIVILGQTRHCVYEAGPLAMARNVDGLAHASVSDAATCLHGLVPQV